MANLKKRALADEATKKFLARADQILPHYDQASVALNKCIDMLEVNWPKELAAVDFIIRPRNRRDLNRARNLASCLLIWLPMPDTSEEECDRLMDSIEHVGKWLSGSMDRKPRTKKKAVRKTLGGRRSAVKAKRPA